MALLDGDVDLSSDDLNFTHPTHNVFNFSMKEVLDILGKEHRILDTYFLNALIAIYVVLMVTGLFSNTMVWLVVARSAQMRTPRNFYVVNLTVSDITLCLISMPFTLINFIQMQWKLGVVMCKLVPVVQGTNIFVSTGTVMAIALDRYFTIVRSKGAPQDKYRVLLSIALIWIVSCLFTFPIIFYQVLEEESIGGYIVSRHCIEKWPSSSMRAAYTLGLLVFQLLIPILVLAGVHVAIANHLNSHRFPGTGGATTSPSNGAGRRGSTLKKISHSSIFRIRGRRRKKNQHTILDETQLAGVVVSSGVAGKLPLLNGNDSALYNISSDEACKYFPAHTMTITTTAATTTTTTTSGTTTPPTMEMGKASSGRVTDYEIQPANGFTPNRSSINSENGLRSELATPPTARLLQLDKLPDPLRTAAGTDDHSGYQGRGGNGGTNNLPNPLQVKFKSNIGVCITFREFCQLSSTTGKPSCGGGQQQQKKRVELLENHTTNVSTSSPKVEPAKAVAMEEGTTVVDGSNDTKSSPKASTGLGENFLLGTAQRDNGSHSTLPGSVTPSPPVKSPHNGTASKRTKKELARNKRTTIILLSVAVIFTVSWMPWHLLTLWADLYPNFTSTTKLYMLYAVCHIIAMTSAVTNAVLYGWLNTNLRRELIQMLSGWVKR